MPTASEAPSRSPRPEIQQVLDFIRVTGNPLDSMTADTLPRLRQQRDQRAHDIIAPIAVAGVADCLIPGDGHRVPVRIYTPHDRRREHAGLLPVCVYFHGGGWSLGSIATHDSLTRYLCATIPAIVVSVDYRLAPEHPFPTGLDDAFAAYRWVAANARVFGGDATRIAVAGDSAGGSFATVVARRAARLGIPAAFQALFYPSLDISSCASSSCELFGEDHWLTRRSIETFRQFYLPDPEDWTHPEASPIFADDGDLRLLPPALIVTADCDPLRDEGEVYAELLRRRGVDVTHRVETGMIHGFLGLFNSRAFAPASRIVEPILRDLSDTIGCGLAVKAPAVRASAATPSVQLLAAARQLSEADYLALLPPVFHAIYGPMAMPAAKLLWKHSGPVFAIDAVIRGYGEIWRLSGPLSIAERSLATIAALVAQQLGPQIRLHINGFLSAGGLLPELLAAVAVAMRLADADASVIAEAVHAGLEWRAQCLPDFRAPERDAIDEGLNSLADTLRPDRHRLVALAVAMGLGRLIAMRERLRDLCDDLPSPAADRYVDALVTHLIVYCGYPKGMNAFKLWEDIRLQASSGPRAHRA